MRIKTIALALLGLLGVLMAVVSPATAFSRVATPPAGMPIQHVVVIFQENHTFDNLLGAMCVQQANRCNGVTTGQLGTTTIPLAPTTDIVPAVDHSVAGQVTASDGGKMDGFYKIKGCAAPTYSCYTQAGPTSVPILWSLATKYAMSDNTYSQTPTMSWAQHMQLGSMTLDGFYGDNPVPAAGLTGGTGWGCISNDHAKWGPKQIWVAPCVPAADGSGPRIAKSPVQYVPDFYDNVLAANGISYGMYGAYYDSGTGENIWCPGCMFSTWEHSSQKAATAKHPKDILTDISSGNLPQVSYVTPLPQNSQHNTDSLIQGDNWIGSVVSAVQNSPYWASTAIVISYDDCGCFYDHVVPPAGLGMRTPLVIVSPYAKSGFVDHTQAAFSVSVQAFVEWMFGLPTLTSTTPDNGAYTWQNSFDFTQVPLSGTSIKTTAVPESSLRYLATHPASQTASADS
jgi:phospholipase C